MKLSTAGLRIAVTLALACAPIVAQARPYEALRSTDTLQDNDAYLLTLLTADPAVRAALAADPRLSAIGQRLTVARADLLTVCKGESCPVERLMLSPDEIEAVGDILAEQAKLGALHMLVETQMRPSGQFARYADLDDAALLRAAWIETAQGINQIFRRYTLGEDFPAKAIDGPALALAGTDMRAALRAALSAETETAAHTNLPFFVPWSSMGLDLLRIHQHDEAIRYGPLAATANAEAFEYGKHVSWKTWHYAAILVPGQGLLDGERGLSPIGLFRLQIAVQRWRDHAAPFLLVSGGHVHPARTQYAEAFEMKRALVTQFGVPAEAVIVDPYARHTTTNLRNAARQMLALGAPAAKPLLISTTYDQADYILSDTFAKRCTQELGYGPLTDLKRVSASDIEGVIDPRSTHIAIADPLDP